MIFDNPFFTDVLLPFLLVFVVVFAILQKSKILGEGKAQIDSMVAMVIGLILIGVEQPREIIVGLMPWMAVGVAVILVFLILYGFVAGDLSGDKTPAWMKNTFGILAGLFTLGVVLYVTGLGDIIMGWFSSPGSGDVWMNVLIILLVIGAMIVAVVSGKKKKEGE
ncbi:hypothetical protein KAI32_04375 [Candidatus Pacearchaeota archaeon]|nr:hypothetical protein [Candidatus Pacearchaeota archaeon]